MEVIMAKKYIFTLVISLFFIVGCKKENTEQMTRTNEPVAESTQTLPAPAIIQEAKPVQKEQFPEKKKQVQEYTTQPQKVEQAVIYPPKIKYLSYTVDDANKNGKIETGEKITLKIKIQNIGKGEGKQLSVKVDTEGKLMADVEELSIWPVTVNGTKQFSLGFWVPTTTPETVPVHLVFSEGTKTDINLTIEQKPKTEQQQQIYKEKQRIDKKAQKAFDELE